MMRDLQIIPLRDGEIEFGIQGKLADISSILLQRLYILLLSDNAGLYRTGVGTGLTSTLKGANVASVDSMDALLAVSCNTVLGALDAESRALLRSFTAVWNSGEALVTIVYADGHKIQGTLK